MKRALGALVLAMLALSACAPLESMERKLFPPMERELFPPEDAAAGDTRTASSRPSAVPPLPRRKPEAISDQPGAIPDQAAAISDQAAAIPDRPAAISDLTLAEADPDRLVGLDFNAAKALLGDPAAKHEEPPAEIWAYEGGICSFSLFFYPSVDDKVFRVLAYEVTDEADALGLRWLHDPPDTAPEAPPEAPKVLDKDDSVARRCFAELLHNQQIPDAG